jgi:large subunit ribosomal protein L13
MKTYSAKAQDQQKQWFVVDAKERVLGRLASFVATRLRGKHRPEYTPHVDTGDYIVVVNADKISLTGRKLDAKMYHHYTGYPGGLKSKNARELLEKRPSEVINHAVRGMLPKNRLGRKMIKKLKVYAGPDHPHEAQQPQPLDF